MRRRQFYSNAPFTRELFEIRQEIKESPKGWNFTIRSRAVRKEFIDYVDAHDIRDPPDQVPVSLSNVAASIEVEMPNGDPEEFLRGGFSERTLVEIITLAIERKCRNNGLIITIIGAVLTIIGTII
ncbi:hypothetical protein [Halorubrum sp. Boch-26]|uniref:hypothetical protein n=1 Tax=Halorubrum sp. Boch-26 TaxID=2994426 RepID=UPI00246935E5|nr:hypothetical protein [Halorubrum sp. Boch-26]